MTGQPTGTLSDAQMDALASLDPETIQRLGDVADAVSDDSDGDGGPTRREIIAMLGSLGVAGGGIAYGAREATAQPDGSPGVIGQQNDRSDLWGDQIDINELNSTVHLANPGELQSTLSGASADDEVWAVGGEHDPGSRSTIPQDVTLRFVGAKFVPSSSYDGFFMDLGSELYIKADVTGTSYTATMVRVDAGEAGDAYRIQQDTHVTLEVDAQGDLGSGTAVHLRSTGSNAVTTGNQVTVRTEGFDIPLRLDADGQFLNFDGIHVQLTRPNVGIKHTGTSGAQCHITGEIQPAGGGASDYGIWNDTGSTTLTFDGTIWDPGGFAQASLAGSAIRVIEHITDLSSYVGTVSGSSSRVMKPVDASDNAIQWYHAGQDVVTAFTFPSGDLALERDGTRFARFEMANGSGNLDIAGSLNENTTF